MAKRHLLRMLDTAACCHRIVGGVQVLTSLLCARIAAFHGEHVICDFHDLAGSTMMDPRSRYRHLDSVRLFPSKLDLHAFCSPVH